MNAPARRPAQSNRSSSEPYVELRIGGFRLTLDRRPRLLTVGRVCAVLGAAGAAILTWLRVRYGA